jgi:outer membrane murein-binding lipoprotein Lpp
VEIILKQAHSQAAKANKQRGNVMAEYGLYLVLAALALVGIMVYFTSNTISSQAQMLATDVTTLVGKVKASYSNDYASVTNANLSSGGFFSNMPSLTNNNGTVTTNVGGGTLEVVAGTITTANDSVSYTINHIPDAACLPIVSSLSRGAGTVKVGANTVKSAGGKADPSKVQCSGDNNTIVLLYY